MTVALDALPAGLDLDTRVALEVMGWGPLHRDRDLGGNRTRPEIDHYPFLELRTWVGVEKVFETEPHLRVYLSPNFKDGFGWRPSRDLACAWRVVEEWAEDVVCRRRNGQWRVTFFEASKQWEAWGETLPLAVCRASLKAAM